MSIYFMAGFPRSGTTLLMNILKQNPKIHTTPTNGLIDMLIILQKEWHKNTSFKAQDQTQLVKSVQNMLKNVITGFFEDELKQGLTCIDKSRGWVAYIDLLERLFDKKVKIIYPLRNIIEVIASMEKVHQKSVLVNRTSTGSEWINQQHINGRALNLLKDKEVFGLTLMRFRELLNRKLMDRILFVNYDDIISKPKRVLDRITNFIGLENYEYDLKNIKQLTFENDVIHGFEPGRLHSIKEGEILNIKSDHTKYVTNYMTNHVNKEYKDINNFITSCRI